MNIITETAINLLTMELDEAIISKLDGRRNWVIRVETNSNNERIISYHGSYGEARRWGYLSCMLRELGIRKIRWYKFTYKKDYKAALELLLAIGVKNEW